MTQREKRKCRNIRGEIIKDYTGWDFRINVAVRRGVEALTGVFSCMGAKNRKTG